MASAPRRVRRARCSAPALPVNVKANPSCRVSGWRNLPVSTSADRSTPLHPSQSHAANNQESIAFAKPWERRFLSRLHYIRSIKGWLTTSQNRQDSITNFELIGTLQNVTQPRVKTTDIFIQKTSKLINWNSQCRKPYNFGISRLIEYLRTIINYYRITFNQLPWFVLAVSRRIGTVRKNCRFCTIVSN